ncbi:hypothetical protein AL755_13355 [Arthrobacter sp. ERGS1:01]|uniref:hypothetical protein n=1 Tax=Arthrobacter sp. ERGS1:01 TaxID=1704044 RepID=UPI0006B4F35F|nr:hypothetical protein [Arthrobacter sp. ERGS1:01]ALE06222.1 hypothetical protein AL755_13355 [Arthrobacter sp. ERGS1:01]
MGIGDEEKFAELRWALALAELTVGELWLKYFALGGSAGQFELEAYICAVHSFPPLERDLLAQAFNEQFMSLPVEVRIPYSSDPDEEQDP